MGFCTLQHTPGAQGAWGAAILGDVQYPTGHGPGQPGLVGPALSGT